MFKLFSPLKQANKNNKINFVDVPPTQNSNPTPGRRELTKTPMYRSNNLMKTVSKLNSKNNNYFGKLPISSNKRDFCNTNKNNPNKNNLNKNAKRTLKRSCVFLKREKDSKFSINENLFADDIKVLSEPKDSASNSIVLYNNHNGYGYVYKISPNKYTIINEAEIYTRLNQLIFHKVCPHLFLTFGSGEITLPGAGSKLKSIIEKVKLADEEKYYCQVNETGPDTKLIMPLYALYSIKDESGSLTFTSEFVKNQKKAINLIRVYYNLIFQYCWVMYVFKLIGFSQGDTHFGNVMLIFNKINIFDNPDDVSFKTENIKYRSYTFSFDVDKNGTTTKYTKTYYLEDLGIDLYIYDFDKGVFSKNININPISLVDFTRIFDVVSTYVTNMQNQKVNLANIKKTEIFNILKLLKIFKIHDQETLLDTKAEEISDHVNIHTFMYFYISCIFPTVQYLNIYKNVYMLVSDKPETDNTNEFSIKSIFNHQYENYSNIPNKDYSYEKLDDANVKAHYPEPELMESIKKRVYASYSTEPLKTKV